MPDAIATRNLTKRYGRLTAVDGLDLRVPYGVRFGLLGPNGSGKTTLVRMLLGLVRPTSGSVELLGQSMPRHAASVLPRVGALVENPAAWSHLSGRSNLRMLDAAGSGGRRSDRRARVDDALDRVGLAGVDRRPVRSYSLGMRQRLGIAAALLRDPDLLLLDEPTNGLDPRGIGEMRELLLRLSADGTTIVLSSHLLSEVEALCTRVGLMDAGRLVLTDDLDALRAPTGRILLRTPDPAAVVGLLDGRVERREGDELLVRAEDPGALNTQLVGAGIRVTEFVAQRRNLEQVVLEHTGASADRIDTPPARTERTRRTERRPKVRSGRRRADAAPPVPGPVVQMERATVRGLRPMPLPGPGVDTGATPAVDTGASPASDSEPGRGRHTGPMRVIGPGSASEPRHSADSRRNPVTAPNPVTDPVRPSRHSTEGRAAR